MKISARTAALLLFIFVVMVFAVALYYNRNFSVLVFAGEDSVATWLSGLLLVFSASLCLIMSMTMRWYPWLLFSGFFLILALDERFMFHERVKEWILFSSENPSRLLYELPVMIAAGFGAFVAFLLWRNLPAKNRILIIAAAVFGLASVCIDIMAAGVLWEEFCKLCAEMMLVYALLFSINPQTATMK
jgi:hypothetical protein